MTPEGGGQAARLHPASVPLSLLRHGRNLLLPGVLVLWLARDSRWELWLMVLFIPSMVVEVYRYLTLRYAFSAGELIVRQGFLFRSERHVPLARIQNIDLVQNPLHRLLGVAEVRLETASGAEPEAVFRVLSLSAMQQMRRQVFEERGRAPAAGEAEPEQTLLRLPVLELAKLGLISNRGLALVALAAGAAWEFDLDERLDWASLTQSLPEELPVAQTALVVAGGLIGAVVLLALFSVIWTIVRFHGFTLVRRGDDLALSCGLITRHSATIPRRRIQLTSMHETIVHRLFDRATIRVETAGGIGNQEEATLFSRRWFAPLLPRDRARDLLCTLHPDLADEVDWQPLAPRARRRAVRIAVLVSLLLALLSLALVRPWGPLCLLVILPLAIWYAAAAVRCTGYACTHSAVFFRSGVFTRKTSAALVERIQVVTLGESPFDRRWTMATVTADTPGGGPAGHRIKVPYLRRDAAEQLMTQLYRQGAAGSGL